MSLAEKFNIRAKVVDTFIKSALPFSLCYFKKSFGDSLVESVTDLKTTNHKIQLLYSFGQKTIIDFHKNFSSIEKQYIFLDVLNIGFSCIDSDEAYQKLPIMFYDELEKHFRERAKNERWENVKR